MTLRPYLAGMAVAGLLSMAACGDDADQASDATVLADSTPSGIDLDAILLTADDLPAGWSEVSVGDEEGGSCLDGLFGSDGPFDPESAEFVTFGASEIGPFLAAWAVDRSISEVLAEVDDVLVSCDGTAGPSGFTTTIDPTPVPGLPQDSLSVHGSDEDANGSSVTFAVAGAGTDEATVFVFAATPSGEIDDKVVAIAVNAMADRIPSR